MRLTPWIMPFAFAAVMLSAASVAGADEHEPLDDAALEEEYGIKEGAVKRDEGERSSGTSESGSNSEENSEAVEKEEKEEEEGTEAGTGGSGSAEDAIEEGESEKSAEDNG